MDAVVDIVVRLGLALLLASAARHKLGDVGRFRATLAEHRVLPASAVDAVALVIPGIEAGLACVLLAAFVLPSLRVASLLGSALLLAVYAGVIATNLLRGRRHVDCGCAGPAGRQPLSWWLVARNGVLVVAALVAALPLRERGLGVLDVGTALMATFAFAMLYVTAERLLAEGARLDVVRGRA